MTGMTKKHIVLSTTHGPFTDIVIEADDNSKGLTPLTDLIVIQLRNPG